MASFGKWDNVRLANAADGTRVKMILRSGRALTVPDQARCEKLAREAFGQHFVRMDHSHFHEGYFSLFVIVTPRKHWPSRATFEAAAWEYRRLLEAEIRLVEALAS